MHFTLYSFFKIMLICQWQFVIQTSGFVTDNKAEGGWSTRELSKEHPSGVSVIKLEVHEDKESKWIGKIEVG